MPDAVMQGGFGLGSTGVAPLPDRLAAATQMAVLGVVGSLGKRVEVEAELDGIAAAIRLFHLKDPDQVMREISAYGARLTELCVLLHRIEGLDKEYYRVRTQQVERYLTELDRQWKIASRLVEVRRHDLEYLRGMT